MMAFGEATLGLLQVHYTKLNGHPFQRVGGIVQETPFGPCAPGLLSIHKFPYKNSGMASRAPLHPSQATHGEKEQHNHLPATNSLFYPELFVWEATPLCLDSMVILPSRTLPLPPHSQETSGAALLSKGPSLCLWALWRKYGIAKKGAQVEFLHSAVALNTW